MNNGEFLNRDERKPFMTNAKFSVMALSLMAVSGCVEGVDTSGLFAEEAYVKTEQVTIGEDTFEIASYTLATDFEPSSFAVTNSDGITRKCASRGDCIKVAQAMQAAAAAPEAGKAETADSGSGNSGEG